MRNHRPYAWLYFLFLVEGLGALIWLLLIPSENARISLARLGLMGVLLFLCGLWGYLGIRNQRDFDKFARPIYIWGIASIIPLTALSLFLLRYFNPELYLPFYVRLSPLLWYVFLLSIQVTFVLLYLYKGFHPANLVEHKSVYIPSTIFLLVLLGVFLLIATTRLGLTYDPAYWGEPGVPILGWQFAVALVIGTGIFCAIAYLRSSWLIATLPVWLYCLAVVLWLSVPVDILENSFYMRISAPDFQPYPFSDSGYYDQMAQSLLIGHPYQGLIPTRPLYITFLAILHRVFGENYPLILTVQTLVLAGLPVVLYFMGRKVHSITAGVIVALFFIFRELTSLLISSETRVTNTKMILVDLPTLLLMLLACLAVFRWLSNKNSLNAFMAGGLFGVLLLLRTQSLVILPFILLIALLEIGWRNRTFYLQTGFFVAGLLLTITPWLMHNYTYFGKVTFDADFQVDLLVSQYAAFGNVDIAPETFEGQGLGYILFQFMLADPKHVLGFISNHFLATWVNALLVLPMIEPYNGFFEPINLYWMSWDGHTAWYNQIIFLIYLVVISIGLGAAWKRWRWLGLLPLSFSIGYAFATALSRFSSWRYDFPADWIAYFYFGVGVAEFLGQAASLFGVRTHATANPRDQGIHAPEWRIGMASVAGLACLYIFVGGLPWMMRYSAAPRYPDQDSDRLLRQIALIDNSPSREELDAYASQPESFLQVGRLLYPRFFRPGFGLSSGSPSPAYMIREYSRLSFYLLNQKSIAVVFPVDAVPAAVPHAEDVIILGCQRENYVEASLIAFPRLNIYYYVPSFHEGCLD